MQYAMTMIGIIILIALVAGLADTTWDNAGAFITSDAANQGGILLIIFLILIGSTVLLAGIAWAEKLRRIPA